MMSADRGRISEEKENKEELGISRHGWKHVGGQVGSWVWRFPENTKLLDEVSDCLLIRVDKVRPCVAASARVLVSVCE